MHRWRLFFVLFLSHSCYFPNTGHMWIDNLGEYLSTRRACGVILTRIALYVIIAGRLRCVANYSTSLRSDDRPQADQSWNHCLYYWDPKYYCVGLFFALRIICVVFQFLVYGHHLVHRPSFVQEETIGKQGHYMKLLMIFLQIIT